MRQQMFYRRILRTTWNEQMRNKEVLKKMGGKRTHLKSARDS